MIAPAPSHSLRWIAHVDLDAFFASCEQRDHPEYQGKPVIVGALPGNRGVVAACSYEARVFGIHSAMPIAEAHRRCPDAIYLRPDISKYKRYSKQVFDLFNDITPFFEKASIDEAYLDISGLENIFGSPAAIGTAIRKRIYQATQLTASVGIGPNRLIAKLGSEANKPDGLTIVKPDEVLDFLAPMPIGNLRGLGKQTQK
ncbi:MAG: DNA polymerase IV, partial [Gammaproteobacteria bacterium]|nr:DNA polymerase IV [Gammaproteobacteria bacterium]